jgi:hypothetical protein
MRTTANIFFFCLSLVILAGTACKQIYAPPAVAHPPDYLVVEGFIENNGVDSTLFTLSRTTKADTSEYIPELGAMCTIEGSDNSIRQLGEVGKGIYGAPLTGFNSNTNYRLHINTTRGKQYASDYVPLVKNPPIDSISWKRLDNAVYQGIQIYANTHDPQNATHYYRWEYQETWEFHSSFFATVRYIPGTGIIPYSPNTINTCWKSDPSTGILLATSTQLAQDVIYEAPLVLVPLNSQQINWRYSILVKQYALTAAAFNWWQVLSKNTEQIGSIFGVLPSVNPGNIRCLTDTNEMVLGYVGGGNSTSQRIFITIDQVRPWSYDPDCPDIQPDKNYSLQDLLGMGYLPWQSSPSGTFLSYPRCVDCTLTGTNIRPSFW